MPQKTEVKITRVQKTITLSKGELMIAMGIPAAFKGDLWDVWVSGFDDDGNKKRVMFAGRYDLTITATEETKSVEPQS